MVQLTQLNVTVQPLKRSELDPMRKLISNDATKPNPNLSEKCFNTLNFLRVHLKLLYRNAVNQNEKKNKHKMFDQALTYPS